ncbi:hypothetical protein [Nonomuraea sp. NPDC005650]|uniref:hypothetical protein n=1 Tax=Nonomuraea sp. NPDC005650 TaxID=3157045 RepID=UPI0033B709ED
MPNQNRRLLAVIMDCSGSMMRVKNDAEGGLMTLLQEQKANPAETLVSLYEFADRHSIVYEYAALNDVPLYELRPWGSTTLLDAIGITISRINEQLDQMPEGGQPGEISLAIQTDGEENWSKPYNLAQVKALITQQRAKGWKIVFLGADQDAITIAGRMGIDPNMALSYGSNKTQESLTRAGRMLSTGGGGFTNDDRNATRS